MPPWDEEGVANARESLWGQHLFLKVLFFGPQRGELGDWLAEKEICPRGHLRVVVETFATVLPGGAWLMKANGVLTSTSG